MEKAKQVVGSSSSSSSSFTTDLFGPKEPSKSSLFGSVFGPSSTGLISKDSSYVTGNRGSSRIQDPGNQYAGNIAKYGASDNGSTRSRGNMYQNNGTVEPCNLSSSIYYGGQDVCSPTTLTSSSQNINCKKDNNQNGNNSNSSASRGNWWEGSLYY